MENKKKKIQLSKFMFKCIILTLSLSSLLLTTVIPTFARSNNDLTDGYYYNGGADIIKASNDFTVTFSGINPMSPNGEPYLYVSRDIMTGALTMSSNDKSNEYKLSYNTYTDRIQTDIGHFEDDNMAIVNSAVSRPIYAEWYELNNNISVQTGMGYTGTDDNLIPIYHRYALLRYVDYCYMYSNFKPTGVTLTCDKMFFSGATATKFNSGFQGVRVQWCTDSKYKDNAEYTFSCTATDTMGKVTHITKTGTISRSRNDIGYDCFLIPEALYTDPRLYSCCMLTDVIMSVRFSDSCDINTTVSDPSFSYAIYQDVVVGDNGTAQNYDNGEIDSKNVRYRDYDFMQTRFYTDVQYGNGGNRYQEGYDIGYDKGKQEGLFEGEQIGIIKGVQDGYKQGQDYGYIQGTTDGYSNGYKEGKADGYKEGQNNPTEAIKQAHEHIGYLRGQENPSQAQIDKYTSIGIDKGVTQAFENLDFTSFIGTAVSGFLDAEIFGNVTLGGILGVCIALVFVVMFLKFFT